MADAFGPLSVVGSLILGIALLWAVRLAYSARPVNSDDALRLVLTIAGWTLIHLAVVSVISQTFFFLSPGSRGVDVLGFMIAVLMTATMGWLVFAMAVGRYRLLEWRSLMWSLSAGAERGIPLDQVARAFAQERSDEIGIRASRLADFLAAGMPLPEALRHAKTALPLDGLLAARFGTEVGNLSPAIARIAKRQTELDQVVRSVFEKMFYFFLVGGCMMLMITFMMLKIVPVFAKMFEEFGLDLPASTMLVVRMSDFAVAYVVFLLPFLMVLGLSFGVCLLYYVGWLPRDFPLVNRFTQRYDGALIMRTLSLATDDGRPFADVIATLARLYPRRSVRAMLDRAARLISGGQHWAETLCAVGAIRAADAAVLEAAERAGNLAWALDEMADSSIRRWVYRLRLLTNVLFPLLIVLIGAVVGFLVVSLFVPLVALIQGLT